MTIRVRHPNMPPKDIDLGPRGYGHRLPLLAMRRPIDESIAYAWARGHQIGKRPG